MATAEDAGSGSRVTSMLLALFLLLTAFMWGCGDDEQAAVESALESGGQDIQVEQGLSSLDEEAFTSADLPLATGTVLEYGASLPGARTQVSFDIDGPWDFSRQTASATLTTEYIDLDDSPAAEEFPGAALVSRYSWKGSTRPDEYVYQSLEDDSWRVFGRSDETGDNLIELSGTSRALLFPLSVGDNWTDSYVETTDGVDRDVTVEYEALTRNTIELPAGDYDAFLVRARVTDVGPDDTATAIVYTWFAPGVGRVAEIVSSSGETAETFAVADAFYWLTNFTSGA